MKFLIKFFRKAGNAKDVRIAMNDDGRPKGFTHVEFNSNADAEYALNFFWIITRWYY